MQSENDSSQTQRHFDFPVVGMGASAGGLAALDTFFRQFPDKSGMAFVVVLHLSPTHESRADAILQRCTAMPVLQVTESVAIRPDHVYIISPRMQLSISDGCLCVAEMVRPRGRHVAIDYFFRTLAQTQFDRAIGIVFSGTGSDGTSGMSSIKETGGINMAQLPADAEYDSMPRSAIDAGVIDIVLPAAELPAKLLQLWSNAKQINLPQAEELEAPELPKDAARREAAQSMRDVMVTLRSHTGHDFRNYKRATVLRRIERRMQVNGIADLHAYRDFLRQTPEECPALLRDMLISVTSFFRDKDAFDALEREVIPRLFKDRGFDDQVRAWVAGCATGEEAYSVAMLLCERLDEQRESPAIQVFATDIDDDALRRARAGTYPHSIVADVPQARLNRFFFAEENNYRIQPWLREQLLFAPHNSLRDPPFSRLDLVCCRNLLIYLEREAQLQILEMFHFALRPGGYLFLGSSESAEAASGLFTPVDKKNRIYQANAVLRRAKYLAALPIAVPHPPSIYANPAIAQTLGTPTSKDPMPSHEEDEFERVKELLRLTVERAETSTEELKASNEELQSINEELRSTTEELETSKEELQALNEELITVNHELKVKVEETVKTNDYLNNFISSTDIATIFVDRAMCIMRYTPRAVDIFSIIPTDVGRPLLDITHRLDYDELAQDAGNAFHSLRVHEREVRSVDGRWFIARMIPYRTTEDRIEGAVLTFIDISRLRGAEDQVRKGEERMRWVVESTLDYAILTTDLDGVVTNWNNGAQRIFGYTESEMLGRSSDVLFTPEDRERGVMQEEMRRARQDGRAEDERWHVRKNGTTFYFSGITNPLNEGGLHGYAKIGRDITDSKRTELQREAQLREEKALRDQAQNANASKDEFLAIMSHELKHPLNLIHVNAELLSRIPEVRGQPSAIRAADTIRKTVLSQAQIIDDLLDLARSSTGKLALKPEVVDWAHVLDTIVATANADAERRNLELNCSVPSQPVYILADPVRLEQIVWNLVTNAIKFTPDGGTIDVAMSIEGECARVDIKDSGIGIEADFLGHVFDMFRQAGPSTTRNSGGLGIGLALVRQLVELHGGKVVANSDGLGYGACFSVWLPLDGADRKTALQADEPVRGAGLEGLRILLVDDSEDTIQAFSELLELTGAVVTIAPGGLEALRRLESGQFDLLLSDIAMPDFDGYMLIRQARRLPHCAGMLAIAVTGFGRLDDSRKALQAGFDAHIGKPIGMSALTGTIERLLKMSPLRRRGL